MIAFRLGPRLIACCPPGLVQVFHACWAGSLRCGCEQGCCEQAEHGCPSTTPHQPREQALLMQIEQNEPRALARWLERMTRGLRDEYGRVSECSTGCAANRTKT